MSLYHESASILDESTKSGTSLKTVIFTKKSWKSDTKTLFALCSEAAKWSEVLSEVIEKSSILQHEKQLTPTLALILTHDLLLSKKGVALPAKHGLNVTISRHKARLGAELTKARIRRGCTTIEALRSRVAVDAMQGSEDNGHAKFQHPRWIRINTIKTTLQEQLDSTFQDFERVSAVKDIFDRDRTQPHKTLCIDQNIPNLVAVSPSANLTSHKAYKEGKLIFQDKASCFPAYLLDPTTADGDLIDATAAPGNKTTHLAAIVHNHADSESSTLGGVIACEKDPIRSRTLEKMVKIAGASDLITIKASQNFVLLDPQAHEFKHVTALLLDPSCSGSGIVGRAEGGITVHLPKLEVAVAQVSKGKKRKREAVKHIEQPVLGDTVDEAIVEETAPDAEDDGKLKARLTALSDFQLRIIEHAMKFPGARRITYSTCSVHAEENEQVVIRALLSDVGRERGWRILRRDEQVEGLRKWSKRGNPDAVDSYVSTSRKGARLSKLEDLTQACIRCEKGSEDGTMGFFVAGFVRDEGNSGSNGSRAVDEDAVADDLHDDDWEGFSDEGQ